MFRGRSLRSVDAKGRLMLPPEFRQELSSVVLTNFDGCVVGYPPDEWRKVESRLESANNPNKRARDFLRFFLGGAEEVPVDGQGRVLVPQTLRDYAGLEKDVFLVGVGKNFEIWDKGRHNAIMTQSFDDISDDLAAAGLGGLF